MKILALSFALLVLTLNVMACPELESLDLAGEYVDLKIDEISTTDVFLTQQQFHSFDVFTDFEYKNCKKALSFFEFKFIASGKHYYGIKTNEDSCDGGNSYGVIFNDDQEIIGDIRDSFITCF